MLEGRGRIPGLSYVCRTMQVDVTIAISVCTFLITVGTVLFKSGAVAQRIQQVENDSLSRAAALQASISLLQAQVMETREDIARNYMTKPEISAIETRVSDKQREILSRMDRMDEKLDRFHSEIVATLRGRAA